MGISRYEPGGRSGGGRRALITAVVYLVLFVLGAVQGAIGSFQYADSPVPVMALVLDLLIFLTCVLAGWGLRTYGAGILPALGWIIASFILAMPRPDGSVVITATSAGEWYLYGGALAAVVGAGIAFFGYARARTRLS